MKKITLLLLCGFIAIANFTKAQAPEILTTTHKIDQRAINLIKDKQFSLGQLSSSFIGYYEDIFFVSDEIENGVIFTLYDKNDLHKIRDFKVNLKNEIYPGSYILSNHTIISGDRITIIYYEVNYKTKKVNLHSKVVDFEGKILVEVNTLESMNLRADSDKFSVGNSSDKSKVLAYYYNTYDESQKNNITLILYDNSLKKISEKKIKFKYSGNQFTIEKALVTNNGRIIIITSLIENKTKKSDNDKRVIKLFCVSEENEELSEIEIGKVEVSIQKKIHSSIDSSNNLILAGFFESTINKKDAGIVGCYYSSINLTKWELNLKSFNLLTRSDYQKIYFDNHRENSDEDIKKKLDKTQGVKSAVIRELNFSSDGSMKIESEIEYEVVTNYSKSGYPSTISYYNQIIELELNNLGELTNMIVVPKLQSGFDFNGFIPFFLNNKTYFVYNDNSDNFNESNENKFKFEYTSKKKATLVYCYQNDKNLIKKKVVESSEMNQIISPYNTYSPADYNGYLRLDNQTVLIWAKPSKLGVNTILKLTFPK